MEQRQIGRNIQASVLGLGCNNLGGRLDAGQSRAVVHRSLDLGVTFFDTANVYSDGNSEIALGEALGVRRKDVVVATKFGLTMNHPSPRPVDGASREKIFAAVEGSLRRLKTDWIDLYQLHEPDPGTPIEETLDALGELIRQGKVREIGCSNIPASQIADAHWAARTSGLQGFVSGQFEYNLLRRGIEGDIIPAMAKFGLALIPYFPLASGMLTGRYERGVPPPADSRLGKMPHFAARYMCERNFDIVSRLGDMAARQGRSIVELAVAWLLAQPRVATVIAGASSPRQVEQNVAAIGWRLSAAELAEVEAIAAGAAGTAAA